jgi:hypothetical protein
MPYAISLFSFWSLICNVTRKSIEMQPFHQIIHVLKRCKKNTLASVKTPGPLLQRKGTIWRKKTTQNEYRECYSVEGSFSFLWGAIFIRRLKPYTNVVVNTSQKPVRLITIENADMDKNWIRTSCWVVRNAPQLLVLVNKDKQQDQKSSCYSQRITIQGHGHIFVWCFYYFIMIFYRDRITRFSTSGFFHQTKPRTLIHGFKRFWKWLRIREVIRQSLLDSGVNDYEKNQRSKISWQGPFK